MKKLACTHCGHIKVLTNRELRKFRKRLSGFTCTNCHKKVSPSDLVKKRGKGPKPKGERRNRSKKEVAKEKPPAVVLQPYVEQFEWRTREVPPGGPRGVNAGWRPKPRQPTDRSMGEATMVSLGIRPSAPIPRVNPHVNYMEVNVELEKLKEERQALEGISEKLDMQEKKLVLIVTRLDRVEERMDAKVGELSVEAESLGSLLKSLATLLSRMETLLSHYEVRTR